MTEIVQMQQRAPKKMQVRLEHLDKLLSLAGEVIITSANLQDMERRVQQSVMRREALSLDSLDVIKTSNESTRRISQDLHDLVMAIRLVEIGDTMRRFRRPVRDLARTLERDVNLRFEGEECLIDKALAERIVDPLLHLLRNAVDHGVESPLERAQSNRPATAHILLKAENLEDATRISVSDDGRGIDEVAIKKLAESNGLLGNAENHTLVDVLCIPGFSSKTSATQTSGRGVGLDLVRVMVDEFGGTLTLDTRVGEGSTFTLTIPKLKAVNIIDALTLSAGSMLFALPIQQIVASLGVPRDEIRHAFKTDQFIIYQEETVPIRDLLTHLEEGSCDEGQEVLSVVIVQNRKDRLALIVSEFLGPQKLVNIPFEENVSHAKGIAGTTVFTGGKLGLTVDIDALINDTLKPGEVEEKVMEYIDLAFSSKAFGTGSQSGQPVRGSAFASTGSLSAGLSKGDISDLLVEMSANLSGLQDTLIELENVTDRVGATKDAFRRLHAIKANFSMLELDDITEFAHRLETALDFVRNERLSITPKLMDTMLDCVTFLSEAAEALPENVLALDSALMERLSRWCEIPTEKATDEGDLIGRTFELSPTIELQMVSERKRGHRIYETFLTFVPGRQAEYLVTYLLLRRLGSFGTVLSTIPSVAEIESGHCGSAVKVLWSTHMDEMELEEILDGLSADYDIKTFQSVPMRILSSVDVP